MVPLQSAFEHKEERYDNVRSMMESHGFVVGGNWDYEKGSFDISLDDRNMVWLRIPFTVPDGNFDPEVGTSNCLVKWGTPYVLKHVYQEGVDRSGESGVFSGMFNQFQEPVDADDQIEPHWIERANNILRQIESQL